MTAVQRNRFTSVFKAYVLPGIVFQSVIIAGGYGTGREMVEYFLNYGPVGGLLGMIFISTVIPDYSSRKHKMSKRARHVESDQRVTGYPQKTAGTRPG